MKPNNLLVQLALLQHMIEGTNKRFANVSELKFASASHSPKDLVAEMQKLVDAIQATLAAKTAAHAAVLAQRETAKAVGPTVRAYRSFLLSAFTDPQELADFGLTPRKPRQPPKTETTAAALAKRKLTREARHTLGRRQKAAIKGTVEVPATGAPSGGSPTPKPPPAGSAA